MEETLAGTVRALRRAGETLADASTHLATVDPGAGAFGAGGGAGDQGRLAGLGRDLYQQWQRALAARVGEAAAHGARFAELGDDVARASAAYASTDEAARMNDAARPEVA